MIGWMVSLVLGCVLQEPAKRPLEHEDCDRWRSLFGARLSSDGGHLAYTLSEPDGGDSFVYLHDLAQEEPRVFERGSSLRFARDAAYAALLVRPDEDEVRKARKAKAEPADIPEPELVLIDLASGDEQRTARVRSFAMPEDVGGWIAWLEADESDVPEREGDGEEDARAEAGRGLVVRSLSDDEERRFEHVSSFEFSPDGRWLVLETTELFPEGAGLHVVAVEGQERAHIARASGSYRSLVFDEACEQLAFLTDCDSETESDEPEWSVYLWRAGEDRARAIVDCTTKGIEEGWVVKSNRSLSFSKSGTRLFFGTAPAPIVEAEDSDDEEDDEAVLDVWSWRDDLIQPMQLVQLERERRRTYLAVAHIGSGYARVVQLADPDLPDVRFGLEGDSDFALGTTNLPYRKMMSWDTQTYSDVFAVDPRTGGRRLLIEGRRGSFSFSPAGRYVRWWDGEARAWFVLDLEGGEVRDLTSSLPVAFHNELADTPALPGSYGLGGWMPNDEGVLAYDRHDVWILDPAGRWKPRCVTEGFGRANDLRFRVLDLDPEAESVDPEAPLLLSAFGLHSKESGFYSDTIAGDAPPERLLLEPCRFSTPVKALDADVLRFTRSTYRDFPDVWVSGLDFADRRRISAANEELQSEFLWGTAELVDWVTPDGHELQGILYKPEDFDPLEKYPLVSYFYERSSDGLHRYQSPVPSRSSIRYPFYTSRGYLVFVPDIPYEVGQPGASAEDAVLSGIRSIIERGIVREDAIGVQGHSWGGYQIAHLVTRTDLFAAAVAGAPVSNMTSAYGGIRWSSGMSRQFQYEKTQSRIGGTLWEARDLYLENSPVFYADRVETPLLMMHNDQDGAVPWYQGIEYFMALRRLGKPAWLLNYNDEGHGLTKYANRADYAVRMQQFFDHFLLGDPAPVWIDRGVPAIEKGRSLGLDLVEPSEE